jgi:hypothetical protein
MVPLRLSLDESGLLRALLNYDITGRTRWIEAAHKDGDTEGVGRATAALAEYRGIRDRLDRAIERTQARRERADVH